MMLAKMPEVEISHDCIANENPDYKTINFTTYAGCFIMHPLNHHLRQHQVVDALGEPDQKVANRFKEYFIDKVTNTNANKYIQVKDKPTEYVDELIVLRIRQIKRLCLYAKVKAVKRNSNISRHKATPFNKRR